RRPGRRARSCTRRSPSTTPRCASPTSRGRSSCSVGRRRSLSTRGVAARRHRWEETARVHRLAALGVTALAGLALALAPTAGATNKLQVGIFDDGAVLYGEP